MMSANRRTAERQRILNESARHRAMTLAIDRQRIMDDLDENRDLLMDAVRELSDSGMSAREIGRLIGLSNVAVSRWLNIR